MGRKAVFAHKGGFQPGDGTAMATFKDVPMPHAQRAMQVHAGAVERY